jgi:hypothetical protein
MTPTKRPAGRFVVSVAGNRHTTPGPMNVERRVAPSMPVARAAGPWTITGQRTSRWRRDRPRA